MALRLLLLRALYRLSPQCTILGVPTAVLFLISSDEERAAAFAKTEAALGLIRDHSPIRFRQVQRDLASIFVCGDPLPMGSFCEPLRMCVLILRHVLVDPPAAVASTIVHEAQHARLHRLGLDTSSEDRLPRIEHACYRAERGFGLRLPEGDRIIAEAGVAMEADSSVFSEQGRLKAQIDVLRKLDQPRWLVRLHVAWLRRCLRRLARRPGTF